MEERYTRLFSLPENLYTSGSPIVIAAGALLKDNQTGKILAQIKFKSISEKRIKAVKIYISTFDVFGKKLEDVAEYQYLDLTAVRNDEFGQKQAVLLPDRVTRSITVKCTGVIFADGTVWNAAPDVSWTSIPKQDAVINKLGGLAAQYQRDTSINSKYIPVEYKDFWLCSCGAVNYSEESRCHICQHEKTKLFAALDLETLQQRDEAYKATKAEKEAKQAEISKAQKAKAKKIVINAAVVIVFIVVASVLIINAFIPYVQYQEAISLLEAGQYAEAVAAFKTLEGYKDSADKIEECQIAINYVDAVTLMKAGQYEMALAAFNEISGYLDSADKIIECKDAIYDNAIALMQADKYAEAYRAFSKMDGYKNSEDLAARCYSIMMKYGE